MYNHKPAHGQSRSLVSITMVLHSDSRSECHFVNCNSCLRGMPWDEKGGLKLNATMPWTCFCLRGVSDTTTTTQMIISVHNWQCGVPLLRVIIRAPSQSRPASCVEQRHPGSNPCHDGEKYLRAWGSIREFAAFPLQRPLLA